MLFLYLDDVIVVASDFNTHLQRLGEVFERLSGAELNLKPTRCEVLKSKMLYLSRIVSADGVATDPANVEPVKAWIAPWNVKELQALIGTTGYCRHYIDHYATIAKPLPRSYRPLHQFSSRSTR